MGLCPRRRSLPAVQAAEPRGGGGVGLCREKAERSRGAGGKAAGRRGLGVSREGGAFPRCGRQSRGENTNQVVG